MFETKEALEQYLNEPRIRCLECGRRLKKLGVHLHAIHGMEPDDYREKYGIPYGVGLACPEVREAAREQVSAQMTTDRMRELQKRSAEKRKVIPNRKLRDAPIIRDIDLRNAAKMREIMLRKERENGPSAAKVHAAKKNLEKAAERLAIHGPTEKQRKAQSQAGRIWGPRSIDKMLAARGLTRRAYSPETIEQIRKDRASGLSWKKLERRYGIPATSVQRLCAVNAETAGPSSSS